MALNFDYPIETFPDGYPIKYLGLDSNGTWHVVTYYVEAGDDTVDTGWNIIEINSDGVLRSEIEAQTPSPTPFVIQSIISKTVTIGIYEDSSLVMNSTDPEALPFGEIGRISLTYEQEAGRIVNATINSILPDRG